MFLALFVGYYLPTGRDVEVLFRSVTRRENEVTARGASREAPSGGKEAPGTTGGLLED